MAHLPPVVLASTSRHRRHLLDALGVPYLAAAPRFVEDHALPLAPRGMALAFARGKAESLAGEHPDALIIGSDQVPDLDGRMLAKPADEAAAVEQILALAGRTHLLHTAVAVHSPREGRTESTVVEYALRMRPLDRARAVAYVARERALDCAGAYRIDGKVGPLLFEEISGPDHTAVIGLPLLATARLLAAFGYDWLALLGVSPIGQATPVPPRPQ
jgi:septum formation protein